MHELTLRKSTASLLSLRIAQTSLALLRLTADLHQNQLRYVHKNQLRDNKPIIHN